MNAATSHRKHNLFLFQEDLVQKGMKSKKPKTKISAAKKILNKNVKINTKIVFDDEGEVRYKLFNTCMLCTFYLMLPRDVVVSLKWLKQMLSQSKYPEWFFIEFCKNKTKVLALASHKGHWQSIVPMKAGSKCR